METTRALINKLTEIDFEFYFNLYGNEEVMRFITGKAYTRSEAANRFREVIGINIKNKETGYFNIFLKNTGQPIGIAKVVITKDNEAEIGYVFLPEYWGKGFGSEISEELVSYSRSIKRLKSLIAITDPQNLASKKILVKCGFSLEEYCMIDGLPGEIYKLVL
jgi:[ribosomal protein S5]-alanine N-acetyltransferase